MRGSFFTVDGEPCRRHRAKIQSILSNPRMLALITHACHSKVEGGLLPFLTRMADAGTPFDMQQLNTRYAFDVTATPVFGADPGLLSPAMPPVHVTDAMDTVMEVPFFRHTMPAFCWKVMRRLGIGPERRLAAAQTVLREFVANMMETGKQQVAHGDIVQKQQHEEDDEAAALLNIQSSYISDPDYRDEVLHATLINYLIAGRDTVGTGLSWLWYNISNNPSVLLSIRKELKPIASRKAAGTNKLGPHAMVTFAPEETKELVYLQAAVFETLRLHPPAPIERKTALGDDTLPSGHEMRAGDTVLISLYAMARMESVWGEDCREYRPERWLSDDGSKLQYVPSHKFLTFSSGPRMCLGKDIGVMQVKTAVANMAWNFDVELVEGHAAVEPKLSCILRMKNGLMMKVKKRVECDTVRS
ncbi:hypothetical protein C2845_PM09G16810 [Panicum miliaceum]|uniref:Alkane hydroxylase MAH1-like n=1 Tax=Panicum miliaceum TaxID=4540 RepID=A0A3L6RZL8_PANMI|nr:hypothetical protein C2845_PM09G16810 [Panicum miliaceum]